MVVVFSSPIGVGLIAVMRILPSGFLLSDFIGAEEILALSRP